MFINLFPQLGSYSSRPILDFIDCGSFASLRGLDSNVNVIDPKTNLKKQK